MIYVLRFVHIVGGVFWVGSVMFATFMLAPSLKALGPGAGPVMNQLVKVRRMPIVMMVSSFLSIVAGIWLFMIDSKGGAFMQTGAGRTFGIGGALAILGLIIGMAVNVPATKRLGAIGEAAAARGGPPTPGEAAVMQRIQDRMAAANKIVITLLILATGAMSVARYVP